MPLQVVYITAILLGIAIIPLPSGFYELLRIVVSGTFAWGAYKNFSQKKLLLPLGYAFFVILFNPVSEITLPKELWIPIDLLAATLLLTTKDHIGE
ncbi:MAG: hypothetical protein FDX21_03995 [Chlorobium sp.]|nr:MAG: hypothetical protein FDX21_03995 [Chlorobium sp.]